MFLIVGIQAWNDGTLQHLEQTASNYDEAMSKWHGVLQYAAVSAVPKHSCCVLNSAGVQIAIMTYTHPAAAEETTTE